MKKIFLFDLDSTITKKEILPVIADIVGKQAEMKERLVDFLIKTMEVVSDDQYEGIHDTHNGKELYLLKKKEIKRKHLHSFYRNGKYIYDYR